MEPKKAIDIISHQRHDFLNHLAVISGLVQLNKVELVPDYIARVSEEIKSMRQVMQLVYSRTALALLDGYYQATGCQVDLVFRVNWNFSGCQVPDDAVASILGQGLKQVLAVLTTPRAEQLRMALLLEHTPSFGTIRLSFPCPDSPGELVDVAVWLNEALSPVGGSAGMSTRSGRTEITILLPRVTGQGEIGA